MSPTSGARGVRTDAGGVAAVAALDAPARKRLYDYVCRRGEPVSRDEASDALDMPRQTAAFHLDRLAEVGLLTTEFARLSGRSGPGAGRPAKLYRRADRDVAVQLPERSYELAGQLLAQAVDDADRTGAPPRESLARRAAEFGRGIGATIGPDDDELMHALQRCGYEPRVEDDDIALANCPFHSLAQQHTALVCGMNLDLIAGVLDGASCTRRRARLEPPDGHCCVRIGPTR